MKGDNSEYKNHYSLLHNFEVLPFVTLELRPGHSVNSIRIINLQPLSNNGIFVGASLVSTDSLDF